MPNLQNLQRIEAEIIKLKELAKKLNSNQYISNRNVNLIKSKVKALQLEAECYLN
jgi:hypothetical protein